MSIIHFRAEETDSQGRVPLRSLGTGLKANCFDSPAPGCDPKWQLQFEKPKGTVGSASDEQVADGERGARGHRLKIQSPER